MPIANETVRHLYLHIPFCPSKCSYCAFVTHIGSLKLLDPYLDALRAELDGIASGHPDTNLTTVYFGGGTPSVMTPGQLSAMIRAIAVNFPLQSDAEVTIEAHPSTVDAAKLAAYRQAGATRISFGAESLDPTELAAVGRSYSPQRVLEVVAASRREGFATIALDLIYGLPGQTPATWRATIETALRADVDHLSLYPLAVEPVTVLARRQREGRLQLPDDERVVEMYSIACDRLRLAGYEHYEVANWARPGHRCRHNEAYWRNQQYHAVGVGAHGYVKPFRYEHVRQTKRFIALMAQGERPIVHREMISVATEAVETIMLRLRLLNDGLDLDEIANRFGLDLECSHRQDMQELSERGLLTLAQRRLRLTETAVPVANEVWHRFM